MASKGTLPRIDGLRINLHWYTPKLDLILNFGVPFFFFGFKSINLFSTRSEPAIVHSCALEKRILWLCALFLNMNNWNNCVMNKTNNSVIIINLSVALELFIYVIGNVTRIQTTGRVYKNYKYTFNRVHNKKNCITIIVYKRDKMLNYNFIFYFTFVLTTSIDSSNDFNLFQTNLILEKNSHVPSNPEVYGPPIKNLRP